MYSKQGRTSNSNAQSAVTPIQWLFLSTRGRTNHIIYNSRDGGTLKNCRIKCKVGYLPRKVQWWLILRSCDTGKSKSFKNASKGNQLLRSTWSVSLDEDHLLSRHVQKSLDLTWASWTGMCACQWSFMKKRCLSLTRRNCAVHGCDRYGYQIR